MKFDVEAMKARFHELVDQREAIYAKTAPLRAKRDAIVNEAAALAATAKPIEAQYLAMEAPIADIGQEIAMLVRALGGQTGERPVKVEQ